jgi:hypothetical protein
MPSATTLKSRSTWNQRGNFIPILATVRLYRILQLAVFVCCPIALRSSRQGDAGIQDVLPSTQTLTSRLTRNQRGNCDPICCVLLTPLLLRGIRTLVPYTLHTLLGHPTI